MDPRGRNVEPSLPPTQRLEWLLLRPTPAPLLQRMNWSVVNGLREPPRGRPLNCAAALDLRREVHVEAHSHPWHLRLLSRQRRLPASGWRDPGGRAGGEVHQEQGRREVPRPRSRVLSPNGGNPVVRSGLHGFLRQAAAETREDSRNLRRHRPARDPLLPRSRSALGRTEALHGPRAAEGVELRRRDPVRGTPRVPRSPTTPASR